MKLSTKGRYAIIALVDLATARGSDLTSLAEVSARQDISLPYLEQLFVRLRRAGLVASVRGPGGGYRLARAPETIRIAEILEAVDETVSAMHVGAGIVGEPVAFAKIASLMAAAGESRLREELCEMESIHAWSRRVETASITLRTRYSSSTGTPGSRWLMAYDVS